MDVIRLFSSISGGERELNGGCKSGPGCRCVLRAGCLRKRVHCCGGAAWGGFGGGGLAGGGSGGGHAGASLGGTSGHAGTSSGGASGSAGVSASAGAGGSCKPVSEPLSGPPCATMYPTIKCTGEWDFYPCGASEGLSTCQCSQGAGGVGGAAGSSSGAAGSGGAATCACASACDSPCVVQGNACVCQMPAK